MRILNESNDKALTSVLIMLTSEEAQELSDTLRLLRPADGKSDHVDHIHVNDQDFTRGITIAIYKHDNLQYFSDRVRKLIESGE